MLRVHSFGLASKLPVIANNNEPHSYSSTQIQAPEWLAKKVLAFGKKIADKDVYNDPDEPNLGRELDIHITTLYGVIADSPKETEELIKDFGEIDITLGKVSKFSAEKYDVIKIEVESDKLHELHNLIEENIESKESDHKNYLPHCTICYVKKGSCKDLLDSDEFEGIQFAAKEVVFSSKDGTKTTIEL